MVELLLAKQMVEGSIPFLRSNIGIHNVNVICSCNCSRYSLLQRRSRTVLNKSKIVLA